MPPQVGSGAVGGQPVGGGLGGLGPLSGTAQAHSGATGHLSTSSVALGLDLLRFDLNITRTLEFDLVI